MSAVGLGGFLVRRRAFPRWVRHTLACGVGLGALAFALFFLGLAGVLSGPVVLGLLIPGLSAVGIRAWGARVRSYVRSGGSIGVPHWLVAGAGALPLAVSLAGSLVPEWFFDALQYQTALPALYLLRGAVEIFPDSVFSAMPGATNLLYLPLLVLGDAGTVKTAHWAFLAGSCVLLSHVAGRRFGALAGLGAAALFAALPGVGITAGVGGGDLALVFFVLAGVVVLERFGPATPTRAEVLAAGILLGTAAASKYTAVGVVALIVALWILGRQRRTVVRRGLGIALGVISVVAVTAMPWYLRNAVVLGDPLYPVLSSGSSREAVVMHNLSRDAAVPGGVGDMLRGLGDLLHERHGLGAGGERLPVTPLLAAALIWGLTRRGSSRRLAVLVAVLVVYWAATAHMLRFLYPGLALAAVLAGGFLLHAGYSHRRRVLGTALVAVVCLAGAARQMGLQHELFGGPWRYLAGRESREAFLESRVQNYPVAAWASRNTALRGTRLLLLGETAGYYFQRDYQPQSWMDPHPALSWAVVARDPGVLAGHLLNLGFSHVVWNPEAWVRQTSLYQPSAGEAIPDVLQGLLVRCEPLAAAHGVWLLRLPEPPANPLVSTPPPGRSGETGLTREGHDVSGSHPPLP